MDVFTRSVGAYGERIAVGRTDAGPSYSQLDARSDTVAAALVDSGVRPGDPVGVATDRSVDLAVAILGVLKQAPGTSRWT